MGRWGRGSRCSGSEAVRASRQVGAPYGRAVGISTGSFVADEIGDYIYTVTAEIGGQSLEKQYTVRCDLFNRYLFDAVRLANDPVSQVSLPDTCAETGSGILLEGTASGAVFESSQVINLNDVSDKYILTVFPYVISERVYMVTLEITPTDIYDLDNVLSI